MKKRTLFISLVLFAAAGVATADPFVDGSASDGQSKSATCAGCHGADGNSVVANFPKLAGQQASYIYDQLHRFKNKDREDVIMTPQASALDDQAMKDLAVYFSEQEVKPETVTDIELAQQGAQIFRGGDAEHNVPACSGCHEASGRGNPGAGYPALAGQHPSYIEEQLHAYRSLDRTGYNHAEIMNDVTRGLSDQQIEALAVYISGLTPADAEHPNKQGALLQNAE